MVAYKTEFYTTAEVKEKYNVVDSWIFVVAKKHNIPRVKVGKYVKISLYLDYYPAIRHPETMIMSRREYLGIYIYAHFKNEMESEFNNDMLNKAEAIRSIRVQSLINEEFGFLDKHKMKADFLAYFAKMMNLQCI